MLEKEEEKLYYTCIYLLKKKNHELLINLIIYNFIERGDIIDSPFTENKILPDDLTRSVSVEKENLK
jgi:hypothetical protein